MKYEELDSGPGLHRSRVIISPPDEQRRQYDGEVFPNKRGSEASAAEKGLCFDYYLQTYVL